MKLSDAKSLCILGRQPALGLAELESLFGAEHTMPLGSHALLDIPAEDINFKNLGGTIKTAKVLAVIESVKWPDLALYLIDKIPEYTKHLPDGKFTLGLSVYDLPPSVKQIEATLLEIKKRVRQTGRPVRIVPNKSSALNSAQVLHNKLTHLGAWELILIKAGDKTLLAQTLFVQDIEAYGARDQARPARDARVGMLPPKLAQIMLNLSAGPLRASAEELARLRVLDPFCGSGVILQEALLMGYSVLGSDIEPRMAEYSKRNLKWLFQKYPALEGQVDIEIGDATNYQWPGFTTIASEAFLGRPLAKLPPENDLKQIVFDANTIIRKFLDNLSRQLKPDRPICLAVPAWRRPDGKLTELPVLAKLTDMGYNYWDLKHVRHQELVYFREDQVVARRLLRLKKA
jgi:tRNA G10  N-methylase Trm11